MKKSLLATTTLIACLTTGASASTTYNVTSNITGAQLWMSTLNLISAEYDGSYTGFAIAGTATDEDEDDNGSIDSSNLTLAGAVFFTGGGLPPININFNFTDGHYAAGSGVTFTAGGIAGFFYGTEDDAEVTPPPYTYSWLPFPVADVSDAQPVFINGATGAYADNAASPYSGLAPSSQTLAGLLLAPGTTALPGLWDGVVNGAGFNSAAGKAIVLGTMAGLYLDGNLTLTPQAVPIPAAAWLFGSGLIGLSAAARRRKAKV
ncbi:MAG TPA: VPLPA-CTERM sorting domain-containing protein [Spongiibacteraceae bacterium]|nr:VPLPA-CTERM sorting domain-containing protein [Spongiibacteraceae bacterium]